MEFRKPKLTLQPRRQSQAFSLFGLILSAAALLLAVFQQIDQVQAFSNWERFLFWVMSSYLVLISLRAAVLIFLSFADRFFVRRLAQLRDYPLVSVILPCYNEEKVVEQSIRSVLGLDYPNFEVLVVDDGSTDMTLMHALEQKSKSRVRVIHQKNQGKAQALNRGISEAIGEYVLCVDADSLLAPDVLRHGLRYFNGDQKMAAVAGCVQIGNQNGILTMFQRLEYIVGLNFIKSAQSFLSSVTIVPGPVGLFRKDAVLAIGGYRSATFAEDCDLTVRLLMNGYRTVYCAEMVAITEAPEDFDSLLKQRYRWSRGTLQAIKTNSEWFFRPFSHPRNFLIMCYLLLETLIIPCVSFLFAFVFVEQAFLANGNLFLSPYFLQLTLLDMVLTAYSVFSEKQVLSLIALAGLNRLTYGLSMEIVRFFSVLDELIGLPMNWNKLQRKGL